MDNDKEVPIQLVVTSLQQQIADYALRCAMLEAQIAQMNQANEIG